MKKIMIFRPLISLGGTEIAMLNLVKYLKGYELYIGYTEDTSDNSLLDEFRKYAEVINITNKPNIKFDILISATTRYHTIKEFQELEYDKKYLWFHYFLKLNTSVFSDLEEVKKLDGIITVSETCTKKLAGLFPTIKDKIIPIYNIIDTESIINKSNIPKDLELSSELNLATTARIAAEKGFPRMAVLAKYLHEAGVNFKWFVIGDNHYKERAEQLVKLFDDFKDKMVWLGFNDNPHNIVKQCDYSVLLSDEETWGLVLTEAMTVGVPCISSDFEAAFEQIIDKENGIILSRDNLDSYKERIDDIINNKEKYKLAVANYKYDNEIILEKWKELLNEE